MRVPNFGWPEAEYEMEHGHQETWSLGLGRAIGTHFRVHVFFVIFVALAFVLAKSTSQLHSTQLNLAVMWGFASLLLALSIHELGHFFVARRLGGRIDSVVLFPWGGSHDLLVSPFEKRLVFFLAGPIANLLACVVTGLTLAVLQDGTIKWMTLLNPMAPSELISHGGWRLLGLRMIFWVNWIFVLINLLPAVPFDGGNIVRVITRLLWHNASTHQINHLSATVTLIASISFLFLAWRGYSGANHDHTLMWSALFMVGVVLLFSMRQYPVDEPPVEISDHAIDRYTELADFADFDDDLSFDDDRIDYEDDESLSQWLRERKETRDRLRRQSEQEDEEKVDAILAQVHEHGMQSLSEEDRLLLHRVSARYRSRQSEQA